MEKEVLSKKEKREQKKELKKREKAAEKYKAVRSKFLTYGLVGAVALFILYSIYNQVVSVPESEADKPVDQILENDWVKGNPEALVVLVEYSDFQCPACASFIETLDKIIEEHPNDIALAYRHFPLKQIHMRAELAAQAAEAAGKQGKFWEMHNMLFEKQDEWSNLSKFKVIGTFTSYAEEMGLDKRQFKNDLNSKIVRGLVKADFLSGLSLRLNSTPSFFLNGKKMSNPTSMIVFEDMIVSQISSTDSAKIESD